MNYYDIIYKDIYIDKPLKKIINTYYFQRLRFIKQLGFSYFTYPSSVHTRFEHSIGVSYLAGLLISNIKQKQPELNITDHDILLIKIAGLLHDIGHACYSHYFDMLLKQLNNFENNIFLKHEERSCYIFKQITKNLNLDLTEEDINIVCDFINPKTENIRRKPNFMYEIICNNKNGLDCDKLDYLIRDSTYLANSNIIDYNQLIQYARVIDNTICYPEQMALILHQVYSLRYTNHKLYYQNPTTRAIEYMMMDAILLSNFKNTSLKYAITDKLNEIFYEYTDSLLERLLYDKTETEECKNLLNRIMTRDLYIYIDEIILLVNTEEKQDELNMLIDNVNKFLNVNNIQNDFILEKYNLNFSMGKDNPLEMIRFYNFKDITKAFNYNKNKSSRILPIDYEETIIRIFIKTDINKKIITKDIDLLFPGSKNKEYTYEELTELFMLYLTVED